MEIKIEDRIFLVVAGLTHKFTLGSFDYLKENQTLGDISNSHNLLSNRILKKEIQDFFYYQKRPAHLTENELLIYYKFNKLFAEQIENGYTPEIIESLERELDPYISLNWKPEVETSKVDALVKKYADFLTKIKNITDNIQERIEEEIIRFRNTIISSYLQPCKAAIQEGGTPDEVYVKDHFFDNYPNLDVQISSAITSDKEIKEICFLNSPEVEKINPWGIMVYSYDKESNSTFYEVEKVANKYFCQIEFANGLHFYLVPNLMG